MNNNLGNISPQNLVSFVQNKIIRLENVTSEMIDAIKKIGAYEDEINNKSVWIIKFVDEHDLAQKLTKLNELGVLFVGQSNGWPPAEVFTHLREKKLLKGNFKEVTWIKPGQWIIREK